MTQEMAALALIFSCVLYGLICYNIGKKIEAVGGFFHTGSKTGGIITLTFGSLTLGTGFIFLTSVAATQGLIAFILPVGVVCGYVLLASYMNHLPNWDNGQARNLLDGLRREFWSNESQPSVLYYGCLLLMLLTYIFLIGFEIFASSQLIGVLLDPVDPDRTIVPAALALLCITVVYTTIGGLRGVIGTDKVQATFIVLMSILFVGVTVFPEIFSIDPERYKRREISVFPTDTFHLGTLLAAFLSAIATQFYSIINIGVGSNYKSRDRTTVFVSTGIGVAVGVSCFILIGVALPVAGDDVQRPVFDVLQALSFVNSWLTSTIIFFLIFGMIGILFSTIDTALMSTTQIIYDNILNRQSFDTTVDKRAVLQARILAALVGIGAFVPSLIILARDPDLVPLLLSVGFAMTAFTPLMAIAIYFNVARGFSVLLTNTGGLIALSTIGILWILAMINTLYSDGTLVSWLQIGSVGIGVLALVIEVKTGLKRTQTE